jgi:hypothetical protein
MKRSPWRIAGHGVRESMEFPSLPSTIRVRIPTRGVAVTIEGGRGEKRMGVEGYGGFIKLKLRLKLFTTCTVCAGLQQVPYAPVAVSGPSQQCHTGNLQVGARPLTT